MKTGSILIAAAASLLFAGPVMAQGICPPAQQCANGPRVPFPIISPVQGLNSFANRLKAQREQPQQPAPPVPWNYAPVATPPTTLPPELQR